MPNTGCGNAGTLHWPGSAVTWHGAVHVLAVQGYHPAKQGHLVQTARWGQPARTSFWMVPGSCWQGLAGPGRAMLGTPEHFLTGTIPCQ